MPEEEAVVADAVAAEMRVPVLRASQRSVISQLFYCYFLPLYVTDVAAAAVFASLMATASDEKRAN